MENKILKTCNSCNKVLGKTAQKCPQRNVTYCRGCFSKSPEFINKVSKTWFEKGQKPIYTHPKGHVPWNKGKKTGQEAWNKKGLKSVCKICSVSFSTNQYRLDNGRGKYCSKSCFYKSTLGRVSVQRGKKYPERSGENNPGWKGGKSSVLEKLRKSFEYEEWRKAVFERDLYTCQFCREVGGRLEADHIKPFAYFPEDRFNISNGRTLCFECHKTTDTYMGKARIKYGKMVK